MEAYSVLLMKSILNEIIHDPELLSNYFLKFLKVIEKFSNLAKDE